MSVGHGWDRWRRFPRPAYRKERIRIPANMVSTERHVAAEARVFEVLIGEVEVCEVKWLAIASVEMPRM